jgi:hypothetical protein
MATKKNNVSEKDPFNTSNDFIGNIKAKIEKPSFINYSKYLVYLIFAIIIMYFLTLTNKLKHENNTIKAQLNIYKRHLKKENDLLENYKFNNKNNELKSIEMKKKELKYLQGILEKESQMPHLKIINEKRTFEKRLPLIKDIKCRPHLNNKELMGFLSLLTKDTIFSETGSGYYSIIAKYYAKKAYSVEGCKKYYEKDIKNGLKNNIIFKDLKPDNPIWSYPGKRSNITEWKNYFQSYEKHYNADVILIDGRFKTATAMDIFDKIKNNTIY